MNEYGPVRKNIVIVDDERVLREAVRTSLENSGKYNRVFSVGGGAELLTLAETTNIDIVLLDIVMPDLNGIAIAEKLKIDYPETKILIMSGYEDENMIRKLLRIGISGYLHKSCGITEVKEAINSCINGGSYFSHSVYEKIRVIANYEVSGNGKSNRKLTIRETEVLQLLAEGYSQKKASEKLNISQRTIEVHKHNVMTKLKLNNSAQLARYAIRNGLIKP